MKKILMCVERSKKPASSPVARDHWGIFELIIKESGDEGSDGNGRSSHLSSLALYVRSHHPSLALLSRVLASSPRKACGGAS